MDEKAAVRAILCYLWKKGLSTRATIKEIKEVESLETVIGWVTCFEEDGKATSVLKTNQGQGDLLWKMRPCLKWMNNSQAHIHCQHNLVLYKGSSTDSSISSISHHQINIFLKPWCISCMDGGSTMWWDWKKVRGAF